MRDLVNSVTVCTKAANYNCHFAAKGVAKLPANRHVESVIFVVQAGLWQKISDLNHPSCSTLILFRDGGHQCRQHLIIRIVV